MNNPPALNRRQFLRTTGQAATTLAVASTLAPAILSAQSPGMRTKLLPVACIALLSWTCAGQDGQVQNARNADPATVTPNPRGLHGYIGYSHDRPPAGSGYSAGMGFYAAVWPLIDRPLANFQIGLPGSWVTPDNSDNKDHGRRRDGDQYSAALRRQRRPGNRLFKFAEAAIPGGCARPGVSGPGRDILFERGSL